MKEIIKNKLFLTFVVLIVFLISCFLYLTVYSSQQGKLIPSLIQKKINKFAVDTLSINRIFLADHSWIATLSAKKTITLIATGDVIPARSVNFKAAQKNNFKWTFEKTSDFLKSADLTLINLESPLIKNCPLTNEGMIFCGDERHIEGLIFAGIDVANLANNHLENYGIEGANNTIKLLNTNGIAVTGVGTVFREVKGVKFAFLGYSDIECYGKIISCVDQEKISREIKDARKNADIIVVSFHWGDEYDSMPNEKQKKLAHLAIDSGADLIIGNHSHWIQPIEIYKGKFITYAHGNFIFDQMWSQKTEEGVVGRYTFYDQKLVDVEFFPIFIEDYGQPHFYEGKDKERILSEMKKTSIENSLKN